MQTEKHHPGQKAHNKTNCINQPGH